MKNETEINFESKRKNGRIGQKGANRKIKRAIHTTLSPSDISKLEEYGDGTLNVGIENVLRIAESKKYNVREQLMKIASHIMIEEISN